MELKRINNLSDSEARAALQKCCGAQNWVEKMMQARPFSSAEQLMEKADSAWSSLGHQDYLEAFANHPKIGDLELLRKKFSTSAQWAAGEQAGVATAAEKVLQDLACGNRDYENKFGYIFIVCATGKSAEEMLAILQARLPNQPDIEIRLAAEEQRKITRLRLEKLCQ